MRCDSNTNYVGRNKKYFLAKFPKNYVFYVHKRALPKVMPKEKKEKKPHYDCYLVGMLSILSFYCELTHYLGGGHTYRSPFEFVFHAAWLMAGAVPGECICVYCDPTNPGQKHRTKSIESNRRLVLQQMRELRASGVNISRRLNTMNRQAFLRNRSGQGTSSEIDEDEENGNKETDTNSSPSGESVERLLDEESEEGVDMEE